MVDGIIPSQTLYDMGFKNAEEFRRACERGRKFAADVLSAYPLQRKEMEKKYGTQFCRQRWPEAYKETN